MRLRFRPMLWVALLVLGSFLLTCGGDEGTSTADDVTDESSLDDGSSEEILDATDTDDTLDAEDTDVEAMDVEIEMVERLLTFRAIFGMSMGANATMITAHHPEMFDVTAGLGGYLDFRYLATFIRQRAFGGFCSLEQILANIEHINEPNNPSVYCGPILGKGPYEFDWDFNNWHYAFGPTEFTRNFYWEVFEGFSMLYGNILTYNPENPLLPPGMPLDWHQNTSDAEKCANPLTVGKPYNINAEYNPTGEYNLVSFCDNATPVGCKDDDPSLCDEDNPDYNDLAADYDPTATHHRPVSFALAVDINGNGRRDYAEPIVVNANERWQDVGADGCANAYEDGTGGCFADAVPHGDGVDVNGDDYDLGANPRGSEGNDLYDEGEPYADFGLDGVAEAVSGILDYGEGNGHFDYSPSFNEALSRDLHTYFEEGEQEDIERITWYFDGGVRDPLHHTVSNQHLFVPFRERGQTIHTFYKFAGDEGSLVPDTTCGGVFGELGDIDWSAAAIGKNIHMIYGDLDATPAMLLAGDGSHVGDGCQVVNRALVFYAMAAWRWPDPIVKADGDMQGYNDFFTIYSEALQNRRWVGITLPPGYAAEENADLRYPLFLFLTGHGLTVDSTSMIGILTSNLMGQGSLPRFILISPDGQCCHRRKSTGVRYCGCLKRNGEWNCVDPNCKGLHETCDIEIVDSHDLQQECNSGNFYTNHATDRWANPDAHEFMRYEDIVIDLINYVDENYRTREAAVHLVPK
jgi:hypothetical protein